MITSYPVFCCFFIASNYVDITVVPKVKYAFQAVAREEKGAIGGVDWNKSPQV